jgi:prevent-host-death family protein
MIEYIDEEKGTVKVINVTEARANFANILGDRGSHYVITKNNKPLRVIVDYDEFERLRRSPQTASKKAAPEKAESNHTKQLITNNNDDLIQRGKKERGIVRGLIETNINLYQTEKAKKKTRPAPKPAPKASLFEDLLGDNVPDYFSEEVVSDSVVFEEEFLPEPVLEDVMETQDEDYFTASDEIDVEESTNGLSDYEIVETQESETTVQDMGYDFEDSEEINLGSEKIESEQIEPEQQKPKEIKRTPEEEEYFNKYKKLYEGFSEEATQAKTAPSYVSEEDDMIISEKRKMLARRKAQQENLAAKKQNTRESVQGDTEPPSLKDLLMDLESEKLSGEDVETRPVENLDEKEIDDLINRITYSD